MNICVIGLAACVALIVLVCAAVAIRKARKYMEDNYE